MGWSTVATIAGVGAVLALLMVIVWIIYNQGKKIGKQEGIQEETKRVNDATGKLADSLYDSNPNSDFKLLHKDGWKSPPKT